MREQQSEAVARWGFRLVVACLLASAWVANLVAQAFGFYVYLLTDVRVQSVWGTLMLLVAGGPLLAEAVAELRRGRPGPNAVTMAGAVATYLYSLYNTYLDPTRGTHPIRVYYWVMALLILLNCVAGLVATARCEARPRQPR